ncbi:MAG TPA: integrin, partial [Hydrogenophaga sp.]|nr:integrin [Hydrogenophaga sp.]
MDILKLKQRLAYAALGITACVLVACGGGDGFGGGGIGGGSGTPSAPTLNLTPQSTKTFHFSWTPVSGATRYVLLEDADGGSGYQPVHLGDLPADTSTYDHEVFLPARVNARYVLQACNAARCADSAAVSVSGSLAAAAGYVKASAQEQDGAFGARVAISSDGNTLAVGASGDDSNATGSGSVPDPLNNGAPDSGAVHVFARSGGAWVQQAYIKASNTDAGDLFGDQVALSADGNLLAVGAAGEDGYSNSVANPDPANNAAPQAGAVYVFRRSGVSWSQEAYVKASNGETNDAFGASLALSSDGTTLAVGAPGEPSIRTGVNADQHV